MRPVPILAAVLALGLAGCAAVTPPGQTAVTGMVATSDGSAIPVGAQVLVRLEEQGVADAEARQIGLATVDAEGKAQVRFRLLVDIANLAGTTAPGWRVRVQKDGRLLYINDTRHPYEPGKAARIIVVPVP